MADLYRRKVEQLETALNDPSVRLEASGILRTMVEKITLIPEEGVPDGHRIELEGDLAAILSAASGRAKIPKKMDPALRTGSIMLPGVAGLGFEPRTFRL